nr:CRISP/Allergen/PR-1-like [Rhipicephalus microplus]
MCRVEYQLGAGDTLHTACKPPNPSCRIRDSGVSAKEIRLILRMHNSIGMLNLPLWHRHTPISAALSGRKNMMRPTREKQYWNAELAAVAQAHANQCSSEWAQKHDEANARKTAAFDAVGQSATWEAFSEDRSKRWWQAHIGKWFAEYAVCPADRIEYFRERNDGLQIGHFTQIIWTDTQFIGCGYSYYTLDGVEGDKKYQGFYVCNYAPAYVSAC